MHPIIRNVTAAVILAMALIGMFVVPPPNTIISLMFAFIIFTGLMFILPNICMWAMNDPKNYQEELE